jgi:small subunit ribosomal protein S11
MLLSFVKRRYWWPRRRYTLSKKFSAILLKKNTMQKIFYLFKSRKKIFGVVKPSFLSVYSRSWLFSILKKNAQRRTFSFSFFKSKVKTLKDDKKKLSRIAKIWVRFSTNNIFFNITDPKNKLLTYFSSGLIGFCGPTKTSSFALDQILDKVVFFFKKKNFKSAQLIFLSGMFNYKSKSVVDSIIRKGLLVRSVTYRINSPHNGLRRRKAKRR